MYLVTWLNPGGDLVNTTQTTDLPSAREAATDAVEQGKLNVCVWVLSHRVESETKVVFKEPNGREV